MCGKRSPVKQWRCECGLLWHTCRIHRYAKASDSRHSRQSDATKGQSPPAENPDAKRGKVNRQSSDLGRNDADELCVGNRKRKRDVNDIEPSEEYENLQEPAQNLKRKWEPDPEELIDLGPCVLCDITPNFLGPALRMRFNGK